MIVRLYMIGCVWFFVSGATSWTSSWQEKNDIFAGAYYIILFFVYVGTGLWYLKKGGFDSLVMHRYHWLRNFFQFAAIEGLLLSIVGFIIGDGGGNNLVDTLHFHSAYLLIIFGIECMVAVVLHRFLVIYEELLWEQSTTRFIPFDDATTTEAPNGLATTTTTTTTITVPFSEVPTSSLDFPTTKKMSKGAVVGTSTENLLELSKEVDKSIAGGGTEGGNLEVSPGLILQSIKTNVRFGDSLTNSFDTAPLTRAGSPVHFQFDINKVACDDTDVPISALDFATTTKISKGTVLLTSGENLFEGVTPSNEVDRSLAGDEREDGDLEAAYCFVSQSNETNREPLISSLSLISSTAPLTRTLSSFPRHLAIPFDGITRRSYLIRSNTEQIMLVKLKRHELINIECEKVFCIMYQLMFWQSVIHLAQIFLGLYLQSVNTPTIPGQDGFFCQTPIENAMNSAQFVSDLFYSR